MAGCTLSGHVEVIVVGGGTAGAVAAGRLAERGHRTLLLEAGPDWRARGLPDVLRSPGGAPALPSHEYYWPSVRARRTPNRRPTLYLRGRGLGGTSLVNGQIALRPSLDQFDEWAERGLRGLDARRALELFRRCERDADFPYASAHGARGPLAIERADREGWTDLDRAFAEAAVDAGHPFCEDLNDTITGGVGPLPFTSAAGRRFTSCDGYLRAAWHALDVVDRATVESVVLDPGGRSVAGVRWRGDGPTATVTNADAVILAAGAVGTPAILMRSGIGPAGALRRLGVPVHVELPVGVAALEHPFVALCSESTAFHRGAGQRSACCGLRYTSRVRPVCALDMAISPYAALAGGRGMAPTHLAVAQHESRSVGRVELASRDPSAVTMLELRLLSDPVDRARLRDGIRQTLGIARHAALRERLGPLTIARREVDASLSDAELDELADAGCEASGHVSSTCRAGDEHDPLAVVDECGGVRGVANLYVADLSVAPTAPRANPVLTAVLLAEHVVQGLL